MSNHIKFLAVLVAAVCSTASTAWAVPVVAQYQDLTPICDNHGPKILKHELGDGTVFPIDEAFLVTVTPLPVPFPVTCVADDLITNDYIVRILNQSSKSYQDLFFVVDEGPGWSVGNHDGLINDVNLAGSPATEAFRIDGTVTLGSNNALISESGTVNEIFEPGEVWEFAVINFNAFDINGTLLPPIFDSVGAFAGSSAGYPNSTASIVANLVPEPAGICLLANALAVVFATRRGNRRR